MNRVSDWVNKWDFVSDPKIQRNIGYQLQYLDFLVSLYNSYNIYLTIESLLIKNINVNINLIIEAVLYYCVKYLDGEKVQEGNQEEYSYSVLIGKAYHEHNLISKNLWHTLHELRKQGNSRHFQNEDEFELEKYVIKNGNDAIDILEEFREEISLNFSKLS